MVNRLSSVKYGYTDHGVRYEKSSDGKKTGKIAGAGASLVVLKTKTVPATLAILKQAKEAASADSSNILLKKAANSSEKVLINNFSSVKLASRYIPMQDKVVKLLSKSYAARIGFAATAVLGTIAACTMAGKLIGGIYDKVVDDISKHKADNAAFDKAVFKKDEE